MLPANLTVPVLNDLPLISGSRPKEESLQVADQPDELDVLGAQLHDDDVDLFKMESPLVVEGQKMMKTRPMLSPSRLFNLKGRLKIRVKMLKFLCHRMLTRMMWRKQAKVADLQRFRIVNLPSRGGSRSNFVLQMAWTANPNCKGAYRSGQRIHLQKMEGVVEWPRSSNGHNTWWRARTKWQG